MTHLLTRLLTQSSIFLAAATIAAASFTAPSHAQFASVAEAMNPEYLPRDLLVFVEGLDLDDSQQMIAEALFDDYQSNFDLGIERMKVEIESVREQIPSAGGDERKILRIVLSPLQDWIIDREAMGNQFLENIRVILMSEQRDRWEHFLRRLYREKHVRDGRFSGEAVNLFNVVRDLRLPEPLAEDLDLILEQYAIALDAGMKRRSAILRGPVHDIFDPIINDRQRTLDVNGLISTRLVIREVNEQYIQQLASALPAPQNDLFTRAAMIAGFPRIYRETPAQRLFRHAATRDAFDAAVIQAILTIEAEYLATLATQNEELLDVVRESEPKLEKERTEAAELRRAGGRPERIIDPTRDVFRARDEMAREYIEQLRAMLSAEAFADLEGSRRWIPRDELDPGDGLPSLQGAPPIPKGSGPKRPINNAGGRSQN